MSPSIFIIGFGRGISSEVATLFAAKGFSIGLIGRNPTTPTFPGDIKVAVEAADATQPATVLAALARLQERLGSPEVVVYNVPGLNHGLSPMVDLKLELLEKLLALGPVCGLAVAQWAAKNLEGPKKTLIYTGGALARAVFPPAAGVGASKAALLSLANNLNQEFKPRGIHVATVTVCGVVDGPDAKYSKELIGPLYVRLYDQGEEGEVEIIY